MGKEPRSDEEDHAARRTSLGRALSFAFGFVPVEQSGTSVCLHPRPSSATSIPFRAQNR